MVNRNRRRSKLRGSGAGASKGYFGATGPETGKEETPQKVADQPVFIKLDKNTLESSILPGDHVVFKRPPMDLPHMGVVESVGEITDDKFELFLTDLKMTNHDGRTMRPVNTVSPIKINLKSDSIKVYKINLNEDIIGEVMPFLTGETKGGKKSRKKGKRKNKKKTRRKSMHGGMKEVKIEDLKPGHNYYIEFVDGILKDYVQNIGGSTKIQWSWKALGVNFKRKFKSSQAQGNNDNYPRLGFQASNAIATVNLFKRHNDPTFDPWVAEFENVHHVNTNGRCSLCKPPQGAVVHKDDPNLFVYIGTHGSRNYGGQKFYEVTHSEKMSEKQASHKNLEKVFPKIFDHYDELSPEIGKYFGGRKKKTKKKTKKKRKRRRKKRTKRRRRR